MDVFENPESDTVFGTLVADLWRLLFMDFLCVIEARLFRLVSQQCRRLTMTHLKEDALFQEALADRNFFKDYTTLLVWYGRCGRDQELEPFHQLCRKLFPPETLFGKGKKGNTNAQRKKWAETINILRGAIMAWNKALLDPLPAWEQGLLHTKTNLAKMNLSPADRHFYQGTKNPNGQLLFLGQKVTLHCNVMTTLLATCPTVVHLKTLLYLHDPNTTPQLIGALLHRDVAFWEGILVHVPEISTRLETALLRTHSDKCSFQRLLRESQCCHLLPLMTQFIVQGPEYTKLSEQDDGMTGLYNVTDELRGCFGPDTHGQLFYTRPHVEAFFTAMAIAKITPQTMIYLQRMSRYPEEVVDYFMEHLQMPPEKSDYNLDLDFLFASWKKGDIPSVRWITFFAKIGTAGRLYYQILCGVSTHFFANIPERLLPEYTTAMDHVAPSRFAMNFAGFGQVLTFLSSCPQHLTYLYTLYKHEIPIHWTIGSNVTGESYTIELGPYLSDYGLNADELKKRMRHLATVYHEIILDPFVSV